MAIFFLEPEYTGMTLHTLSSRIDGGNIFHQTSIKLNKIMEFMIIHVTVKEFIFDLPKVINFVSKSHKKILGIKQRNKGILWTQKMWKTSTLNFIYNVHKDKINQYCIRNKNNQKTKIIKYFKYFYLTYKILLQKLFGTWDGLLLTIFKFSIPKTCDK